MMDHEAGLNLELIALKGEVEFTRLKNQKKLLSTLISCLTNQSDIKGRREFRIGVSLRNL